MTRRMALKAKDQRGEVMIEASIVMVFVIVMVMVLISISFMFYQEALMNSVANEIAADIAKNYKYIDMEVGSDTISSSDAQSVTMFRTSFGKGSLERAHKRRADGYADWRVGLSTLGLNAGDVQVLCEVTSSGLGRAYVKVTVSQESDFFLSGILEMTGIMKEPIFSSTAYAECVDLMGYTSMVNFTAYVSDMLGGFGAIGNLYGSIKNMVSALTG